MTLTWDEVRKRSEQTWHGKFVTYCFDCELNFFQIGMSCDKHALNQSEQDERAARINRLPIPSLQNHPLLQMLPNRIESEDETTHVRYAALRSTTSGSGSTD